MKGHCYMSPAVVAWGFVGCVSPDTKPASSLSVPARFSTASTNAPVANGWLTDFNAPRLESLVREALENNPDIRLTAARLKTSVAEARIAGADRKPQIEASFNASRTKRSSSTGFKLNTSRANRFGPSLNLSWELDVWGRLADARAAAHLDAEQAAANLEAARLSLAANTAKAWFDASETHLQVQLANRTLDSYEKNLTVLEEGLRRGLVEALDVRLMRTSVQNARNQLALRKRQHDGARRTLEVLAGRYPRKELEASAALPKMEKTVPTGLPSGLLERRPDIIAAQTKFNATHRRVAAARKALLPKISLTASGGTSSDELKDVLDIDHNVWSLVANLTQPLLNGGRLRAQVDRARALREEARFEFIQAALAAFQEVETSLAAEMFLKEQVAALDEAAAEARKAEALALSEYQAGLVEIIAVLEAQRRSFDAQRSLIEMQNERLQNRVDLYLALGGPFESAPEK
ncbi:MAG: transporter [Verrucomicrobiales bacterium]|nr:transporter [Verrucomicrobiales bacterium]